MAKTRYGLLKRELFKSGKGRHRDKNRMLLAILWKRGRNAGSAKSSCGVRSESRDSRSEASTVAMTGRLL